MGKGGDDSQKSGTQTVAASGGLIGCHRSVAPIWPTGHPQATRQHAPVAHAAPTTAPQGRLVAPIRTSHKLATACHSRPQLHPRQAGQPPTRVGWPLLLSAHARSSAERRAQSVPPANSSFARTRHSAQHCGRDAQWRVHGASSRRYAIAFAKKTPLYLKTRPLERRAQPSSLGAATHTH